MKIKIELDDGYEKVFEADEENDEIEDLGTTKEMMQARIEELEELNRDKSGDIVFYHEANKECQKTIDDLRGTVDDWKKRHEELRRRLEEETDRADGWEQRCSELEQELRDAQGELNESARKEAALGLEAYRLGERIREQDVTIAKYDDQNRELKAKYIAWDRGSTALTRWARAIHENAVNHGWWTGIVHTADDSSIREDVDRPLPEILMLCVCELAESMEEYRNGKPLIYDGDDGKPEGIAVEMVDCIIRILDWMGHNGVDVDELIRKKHEYNKGRPYRHGGKKA